MTTRLLRVAAAVISVAYAAPLHAQSANAKRDSVVSEISGFSVILVAGETQPGGSVTQDVPAGARKALNDMREFLPYKHYRVLDVQWISCCLPKSTTTVVGRLQGLVGTPGPGGSVNLSTRPYVFSVAASSSNLNIPVSFLLWLDDSGSGRSSQGQGTERTRAIERERQDVQAEVETLTAQLTNLQQRIDVGTGSPLELRPMQDRQASLRRRLADLTVDGQSSAAGSRPIIDSSFTMDAGETVVVGTSKLGGDKALIAIVTAVRKNTTARE